MHAAGIAPPAAGYGQGKGSHPGREPAEAGHADIVHPIAPTHESTGGH
jgi:hypothetical protein